MKKIACIVVALCIVLSFCGCNGKSTADSVGIEWDYTDSTLRLSGSGVVDFSGETPWKEYNKDIISLIVEKDITEIGDEAFGSLPQLSTVIFMGVNKIGSNIFGYEKSLDYVYLPETLNEIADDAFQSDTIAYVGKEADANSLLEAYYGTSENIVVYDKNWNEAYNTENKKTILSSEQKNAINYAVETSEQNIFADCGVPGISDPAALSECDGYYAVRLNCTNAYSDPGWFEIYLVDKYDFDAEFVCGGNGFFDQEKMHELKNLGFEIEESEDGMICLTEQFTRTQNQIKAGNDHNRGFPKEYKNMYLNYIKEQAQKQEDSEYAIHDFDNDGIPELIMVSENHVEFYLEDGGMGSMTATTPVICTSPRDKGIVIVDFYNEGAGNCGYRGTKISENGIACEAEELFDEKYKVDLEEVLYTTNPFEARSRKDSWNPSEKIPGSEKINTYAITDLSGIELYEKSYGTSVYHAVADIMKYDYNREYALYNIDNDVVSEIIVATDSRNEYRVFKLESGNIVNLGTLYSSYGLYGYKNQGLFVYGSGTGYGDYILYKLNNGALYVSDTLSLFMYAQEKKQGWYLNGREISEAEYREQENAMDKLSFITASTFGKYDA